MIEWVVTAGAWGAWVALALCAHTYLIYPAMLAVLSKVFGRCHRIGEELPEVTLLIPAHNEVGVIRTKIENSLALEYPRDRLQIRVVSDGSDDGTDEIVKEYAQSKVELHRIEQRAGKPNAMNQAVSFARGQILLLCDANTMFASDAVRRLVRHFEDPTVGAVTGDVRLTGEACRHGEGEGLFFRLERAIQTYESRLWTSIGVDGGMYAVRASLYQPVAPDTLIDDFVIAMNVARTGARVLYDATAQATEDAVVAPVQEFRRRVRTTAGGFQSLFEGRGRPRWHQPFLWFGYLSHKVLRWTGPFLLVILLACNALVVALQQADTWKSSAYLALLLSQAVFYALAITGRLWPGRRLPRVLALPYYFMLGNLAAGLGFFRWALRRQPITWQKADRTPVNLMAALETGRELCEGRSEEARANERI